MPTRSKRTEFTDEEKAYFASLTEGDIRQAADADPDAPVVTDAEMRRAVAMRRVRIARKQRELTQEVTARHSTSEANPNEIEGGSHVRAEQKSAAR